MKILLLMMSLVLISCGKTSVSSLQGDVANSVSFVQEKELLRTPKSKIALGTVSGFKAFHFERNSHDTSGSEFIVAELSSASNATSAKAQCKALSPEGKWRLLSPGDLGFYLLYDYGVISKVEAKDPLTGLVNIAYPAWVDNSQTTSPVLSKELEPDDAFAFIYEKDLTEMKTEQKANLRAYRLSKVIEFLEDYSQKPGYGEVTTQLMAKAQAGIAVRCVLSAKGDEL